MDTIILAVVSVVIIALLCALLLVIASKVMAVQEDPIFPAVRECLPGANCGACGYAGCDGYAKALAAGEEVRANLCVPGGAGCAVAVAAVLGVEAGAVEERVAVVLCGGDCTKTETRMSFDGPKSCGAAKLLFSGPNACMYGCLGCGDCAAVCPQGAIRMEKGIALVDRELCIGCGQCQHACPNHIIHMLPKGQRTFNRCSNPDMGKAVMEACKAGCIGCTKCCKACPEGAVAMEGSLAQVDAGKCTGCGACVEGCPTKCMSFTQ